MTAVATSPNPVWQAFEDRRQPGPHLWTWAHGAYRPHTWDDWRHEAERAGAGLRERGVEPGARVAAVLTNTFDVLAGVIGTWLAGGTLLSLPTLRRGQPPEEYVAQLRRLCRRADAQVLLLEDRFLEFVGDEDLGAPVASFDGVRSDAAFDPTPPLDDDIAFVQYSSGSTSEPRGCMLSMRAIGEQERMLADRLRMGPDGLGVVWLPLSHDMGLFGCGLQCWTSGARCVFGTPERFLRKPHTWMDDCARFGATITVTPNFALAIATRIARERPPTGRFPLRTLVLGGERIEVPTLTEAAEVLGPYGVTAETLTPAYGLAEATLSVTMKRFGEVPSTTYIDRAAAQAGELVPAAAADPGAQGVVACGPPVDGVCVRTEGDAGIGRICVRSAALADGYLDDPEATARCFRDGELITGDFGFIRDGELHVLGRVDDVIVVGGRNVWARDVEVAAADVAGVRAGCAALVDVDVAVDGGGGEQRLVVIAEPASADTDLRALSRALAAVCHRAADVDIDECVFVAKGVLPKTPSGKIQRFRCRGLLTAPDAGGAILERVAL